jgi:hypothetical protein
MINEASDNNPSTDSEKKSPSQSDVTPAVPEKNKVTRDSNYLTHNEENATVKLQQDIKTGEKWLIGINLALLVANIVIASIYYGQLSQMKKATEATKIAANAAKDSADLQRTIIEGTQAAEVMPNALDLNDRNFLKVSVENVGGVASATSSVRIEVTRQHLPDNRPLGDPQVFAFTTGNLRVKQPSETQVFEIKGYTQNDKWSIYHKKQAIVMNVTIEFENGFGKMVQRKFCDEFISIYEPNGPLQPPNNVMCESVPMRQDQVLPVEQRAWKWQY